MATVTSQEHTSSFDNSTSETPLKLDLDELRRVCANLTEGWFVTSSAGDGLSGIDLTTGAEPDLSIQQKDALLYIVVVLGFYSVGVVLMVIMYLKREQKEMDEERMMDDYLRFKPETRQEQRAKLSTRLALNAFNAANLISQPHTSAGKITFV